MANKQKTRVVLPGGIQGLVHTLQNGTAEPNIAPQVDVTKISQDDDKNDNNNNNKETGQAAPAPAAQQPHAETTAPQVSQQPVSAQEEQPVSDGVGESPATATAEGSLAAEPATERAPRGRRPKENTMKEYTVVKDDSRDSWDLFLDMAKQYKDGGGKLATIYIDESLKNVLDRMKYCGPEKLSTSAILSSIVARFIFDHEDDIKKVMFSGRLI